MKSETTDPKKNELLRLRRWIEKIYEVCLKQLVVNEETKNLIKDSFNQNEIGKESGGKSLKKDFLEMEDILEIFRISRTTYYRLKNDGFLKPIKVRGRDFYHVKDIERLIHQYPKKYS